MDAESPAASIAPPDVKAAPVVHYKKGNYVMLEWPEARNAPGWDPKTVGERQHSDVFAYIVFSRAWDDGAWGSWRQVCRDKKRRRSIVVPGLLPGARYQFAIQVQSTGGNTSGMSPAAEFAIPLDAAVTNKASQVVGAVPVKGPANTEHIPPEEAVHHHAEERLGTLAALWPTIRAMRPNYFATIPLGIEHLAVEDCVEELQLARAAVVCTAGHLFFRYEGAPEAVQSVTAFSNVYAFVEVAVGLPLQDKDAAVACLAELPRKVAWADALRKWEQSFPGLPPPLAAGGGDGTGAGERGARGAGPGLPSFRVACERLGHHPFRSVLAAAQFGATLNEMFGWPANLNRPDLEVYLRLMHGDAVVGVTLTRGHDMGNRISRRKDTGDRVKSFCPTTLQSCVAHCLARLGRIRPGMVVCDPMAGTASVCVQGLRRWPGAAYVAGDRDPGAIGHAATNCRGTRIDVVHWDVTRLPLRAGAVDVVVSDMPFGQRCGKHSSNVRLYNAALRELARVCRPGTGRAVLLTTEHRLVHEGVAALGGVWAIVQEELLHMGHRCHCFVLDRTAAPLPPPPPPEQGPRGAKRKAPTDAPGDGT